MHVARAHRHRVDETLARLPGRAALAKRIDALSDAGTIVYDVVNAGPRWFRVWCR